jgi:hypothetical protein
MRRWPMLLDMGIDDLLDALTLHVVQRHLLAT